MKKFFLVNRNEPKLPKTDCEPNRQLRTAVNRTFREALTLKADLGPIEFQENP